MHQPSVAMELVVFWCGRWARTPGRKNATIPVAESDALFWHELPARNFKERSDIQPSSMPLCNPGSGDSTRGNTSRLWPCCPGGMCATDHFPARVRTSRHNPCKPRTPVGGGVHPRPILFSPSSPPPRRHRSMTAEPRWAHGQTAPASLVACTVSQPASCLRVRILRNDVTMGHVFVLERGEG